jgi:hypothetical protein
MESFARRAYALKYTLMSKSQRQEHETTYMVTLISNPDIALFLAAIEMETQPLDSIILLYSSVVSLVKRSAG